MVAKKIIGVYYLAMLFTLMAIGQYVIAFIMMLIGAFTIYGLIKNRKI